MYSPHQPLTCGNTVCCWLPPLVWSGSLRCCGALLLCDAAAAWWWRLLCGWHCIHNTAVVSSTATLPPTTAPRTLKRMFCHRAKKLCSSKYSSTFFTRVFASLLHLNEAFVVRRGYYNWLHPHNIEAQNVSRSDYTVKWWQHIDAIIGWCSEQGSAVIGMRRGPCSLPPKASPYLVVANLHDSQSWAKACDAAVYTRGKGRQDTHTPYAGYCSDPL